MRQTIESTNRDYVLSGQAIGYQVGKVAAALLLAPLSLTGCDSSGQCVPGTANFTQQDQQQYILYVDEIAALSQNYQQHTQSRPLDSKSGQALQTDLGIQRSKNVRVQLYIPRSQGGTTADLTTEADNAARQLANGAEMTGKNLIVVLPTEVDPSSQKNSFATIRVTSGTCE